MPPVHSKQPADLLPPLGTSAPQSDHGRPGALFIPPAGGLVGVVLACASLVGVTRNPDWFALSQQDHLHLAAPLAALGSCLLLAGLLHLRRTTLAGLLQGLFILLAVAAVANCDRTLVELRAYGDVGQLGATLEARASTSDLTAPDPQVRLPNTRWLLGSALLRRAYRAVLPLASSVPGIPLHGTPFVRATGAILMALASVLFLRRHPERLALLLPLTTPVWLLFASGYDEYYPFIAWMYLVFLLWLESGLPRRPALAVGLLGAALALTYVGYVPLALLLLAAFGLKAGVRRGLLALILTVLLVWGGIHLLWPATEAPLYSDQMLHVDLSLGEDNVCHPPYAGQSAASWLPFFRPAYALSAQHLTDLAGMLVLGAGPVCLLLLAWRCRRGRFLTHGEGRFLGLAVLLQGLYFLAMVPKFGPVRDVDLFFTVYLTAAFVAGLLADRWLEVKPHQDQEVWRRSLTLANLGSSGVLLAYLLLARG